MKASEVRYIVDKKGERSAVVLPANYRGSGGVTGKSIPEGVQKAVWYRTSLSD